MSMWDTLDRLINKPQPKQLAQVFPALATYLEQSQGLGEKMPSPSGSTASKASTSEDS